MGSVGAALGADKIRANRTNRTDKQDKQCKTHKRNSNLPIGSLPSAGIPTSQSTSPGGLVFPLPLNWTWSPLPHTLSTLRNPPHWVDILALGFWGTSLRKNTADTPDSSTCPNAWKMGRTAVAEVRMGTTCFISLLNCPVLQRQRNPVRNSNFHPRLSHKPRLQTPNHGERY